jgi:hypothetical protein
MESDLGDLVLNEQGMYYNEEQLGATPMATTVCPTPTPF